MASSFPLNAWYAAGWSRDIGEALTAITICDLPVLLFRRSDGGVSALLDACLHRLLPLSMGRREGDRIVCGYHGMTFDAEGRCVSMPGPGDARPAANACVRSFPLVECHNMVWIWPGDPARADPARVPDLHWADDPGWASKGGVIAMDCDYRLVIDNLMDLTHETFVHASSIGDARIVEAPFEVRKEGDRVILERWMIDIDAPPFLAAQLKRAHGLPPENVDRWQVIEFQPPAVVIIDVGVAKTGTGARAGDRAQGISGRVLDAITPATATSCHYFFAYARDFALDDAMLTDDIAARNLDIFLEDKAVLEAQQRSMALLPDQPLRNYAIDRGSIEARKLISTLVAAEA